MVILLFFVLHSCNKDEFDTDYPDVHEFVEQLKNGTYSEFEYNESGERLWAIMPNFTNDHVAELIELANDTSFLPKIECIPLNPMSSRVPFPSDRQGKIYLAEYLLWCAQYAIDEGFPSLDPFLVDNRVNSPGVGISAKEILEVRTYYQDWYQQYGDTEKDDEIPHPLSGTSYRWF